MEDFNHIQQTKHQVIQSYLRKHFPEFKMSDFYGKYWIRFELGGSGNPNGSTFRLNQAYYRAKTLFNELFLNDTVLLIANEYHDNFLWDSQKLYVGYLSKLLSSVSLEVNKGPFRESNFTSRNGVNQETLFADNVESNIDYSDIILTHAKTNQEHWNSIIEGIINREQGIKPKIPQQINFFNLENHCQLHIYDDRGCDLNCNDYELMYNVFQDFNHWVLDYDKEEIGNQFKTVPNSGHARQLGG